MESSASRILQIVRALLLEYNYVIIPDFGGFVANYEPAKLIADKQLIAPPSKKIAFNAALKTNDGLLINALSVQESISQIEAEQWVRKLVSEAFLQLDKGHIFKIDKLGVITLDENLNMQFVASNEENYNAYSYGLVAVKCVELNNQDRHIAVKKTLNTRKNLVRVAVVLPFLMVGIFMSYYLNQIGFFNTVKHHAEAGILNLSKAKIEKEDTNPISKAIDSTTKQLHALDFNHSNTKVTEEKQNPAPIDTLEKQTLPVEKTTEPTKEEGKPAKVESVNVKTVNFELVVGSFSEEQNAKRMLGKLTKAGFEAKIIRLTGRFKVIAGGYELRNEAEKTKDELKSKDISSWINKK